MSRDEARIVYYALAVASGGVLALLRRIDLLGWVFVIGAGVSAAVIRSRWLHATSWSRTDLSWGLVFIATFLPIALVVRTWPFGS